MLLFVLFRRGSEPSGITASTGTIMRKGWQHAIAELRAMQKEHAPGIAV
jgi:hypothetical protein